MYSPELMRFMLDRKATTQNNKEIFVIKCEPNILSSYEKIKYSVNLFSRLMGKSILKNKN